MVLGSNISFLGIAQNNKYENEKELKNGFFHLDNIELSDLLFGKVKTTCGAVDKITDVNFALYNNIDVDDDPVTGENGNDIRVQYLLLPWIEFDPVLLVGAIFTVSVERIGDEIKNEDFNISMELANGDIDLGFFSPSISGNEIPDFTRISFMFLFNPFERTSGFAFYMNPEYVVGNEDKKLLYFANYKSDENLMDSFSFEFDPPMETQLNVIRTKTDGRWSYSFQRESSIESKVTASYRRVDAGEVKEVTFSVDKIPVDFSFELELTPFREGGGSFIYESDETYDVELVINTDQLGVCEYATLLNTPRKLVAEWVPTIRNGYYSVYVESGGTDFILKDSLIDPVVNLTVLNVTNINIVSFWNLSNPGDFIVEKNLDVDIDLNFVLGEWTASLGAVKTSNVISTSWFIDFSGYLMIDTDDISSNKLDILIKNEDLAFYSKGEFFKADDFNIIWTLWPPAEWNLEVNGKINFLTLTIYVYFNGAWHLLWPLL